MGKRRRRSSSPSPSSATSTSSSSSTSTSSSSSYSTNWDAQTLFATMLAAIYNRHSHGNLVIQKALHHLLLSLLSKSPNLIFHSQKTLHTPLISLLPLLLNYRCSEIACSGLETVGAASLFSIEMNEQIAFDDEIVKGLITAVISSRRSVSIAACNAVLDLCTTSIGRCRLLEFSAIDNIIFCFLQVPKSSTPSVTLVMEKLDGKNLFRIGLLEDEYIISLLHALIILINDCTLDQLRKIPTQQSKNLLKYLAKLWVQVHKHIPIDVVQESERFYNLSNITTNNLAESVFRLSMEEISSFTPPSMLQEVVKKRIFHNNFESFIMNHWEKSPLLIKKHSLNENAFSSFSQFLNSKKTVFSFLDCLLKNLSSAIPISSDELDITSFLKESRPNIGCLLIYQQDIRVVKTLDSKREKHFMNAHDTLKCEEAYNDGYTFALRGMEFRFKDIAAVSEGLTYLFGQPSTGVNMYLTPPNSQGLARHRDDHCVLVCQIKGVKRWKIFSNPCPRLPRLYENVDLETENGDEIIDGCKEFLLREGDILYIPRGFPHEACTIIEDDDETNGNAEFSLHLTLAIEIEPPFEWEGFVHVALYVWGQNSNFSSDHSSHDLADVAVHLMHIAIKLIGDVDPTCRKACLISAVDEFLQTSQRSTFNNLLSIINSDSNFNNVFAKLEVAIRKNEDLFENLRWVRHLDPKLTSMAIEDLFHLVVHHKDKVEAAFIEAKYKFCNEVVFDDVVHHYSVLLGKFRSIRKQYINGMLALSCI